MENSDRNIFVTGRAGTGKSTLLTYFREHTRKKVVVLAPTGVAALNVKGQTIHSFFKFKPHVTLRSIRRLRKKEDDEPTIYEQLDSIIIDEISMVRADLLDCVERFLRLNGPDAGRPFGGVQMVFIGDLYQLPPVVTSNEKEIFNTAYKTPYFFGARVFDSLEMDFVELEKIYRQHDDVFIHLLNGIRNNSITDNDLALLNKKCISGYEAPADNLTINLTTTNALAEQINTKHLEKLDSVSHYFTADIEGEFGKEYLPTATTLHVKAGAQVMMVNNDLYGGWVNGTLGKIVEIDMRRPGKESIIVELADGDEVEVFPNTWEIYNFSVEEGQIQSNVVGTFTQYPVIIAWAVTIHKSQGKTFDRVVIDIGRGTFAHGQMYVALSRCTSLDGVILKQPVLKKHIRMDYQVVKFLTKYQYDKAEKACSAEEKIEIIKRAIDLQTALRIVYLKPNDEKSTRIIMPREIGEMEYGNVTFTGVRAFCTERKQTRVFRVDRILEIEETGDS
jgi:ATP-dependent DNA helicase PIF1